MYTFMYTFLHIWALGFITSWFFSMNRTYNAAFGEGSGDEELDSVLREQYWGIAWKVAIFQVFLWPLSAMGLIASLWGESE